MDRNQMRSQIFGNTAKRFRSTTITFMDVEIELKQPSLRAVLEMRSSRVEDPNEPGKVKEDPQAFLDMIIMHSYIPGTNERLFDDADKEALMNLPFGDDYQRLVSAMEKLMGQADKEALKGNSGETTSDSQPIN